MASLASLHEDGATAWTKRASRRGLSTSTRVRRPEVKQSLIILKYPGGADIAVHTARKYAR